MQSTSYHVSAQDQIMPDSIHPATHIGTVALTVTDLDRSLDFYQRLIGLRLHRRDGDTAYLELAAPTC